MAKLTKAAVDALHASGGKPSFLWDSLLSGFGVKALGSGKKQYVVKYRAAGGGRGAPQRWLTLGSHGQITCEEARTLARKALGAVAHGEDPQQAKVATRASPTLHDAWARFAEEWSQNLAAGRRQIEKPSQGLSRTHSEYVRQWAKLIEPKLGSMPVRAIGTDDIERLRMALARTPYQSNRVVALMSRLLSLCETWEWRDQNTNPCRTIRKFKEKARTAYLNHDQIEKIGQAMDELVQEKNIKVDARNAIQLLLLTGARLNEILEARISKIDIDQRVLHLPASKSGERNVYLSPQALNVITDQLNNRMHGSDRLFPGSGKKTGALVNLRKPWVRICARAGVVGIRIHDLRHTAASIAVKGGASLPMIGRVLGHTQAQTTLRYAHVAMETALATVDQMGGALGDALRVRQDRSGSAE